MKRIQIDTEPWNMLVADQTEHLFHNEVERRFTYHDAIVVGLVDEAHPNQINSLESPTALHSLSLSALELEGVIAPGFASTSWIDNVEQAASGGRGRIS